MVCLTSQKPKTVKLSMHVANQSRWFLNRGSIPVASTKIKYHKKG